VRRITTNDYNEDLVGTYGPAMSDRGIVTTPSPFPFKETVSRLQSALETHGVKIFAVIDQQAAAESVGMQLPPTTLIIFGNPKGGTPLMLAQPSSALDLPLKVLIAEATPGQVEVSCNDTGYLMQRHALPPALASNIAPALQLIGNALKP
jgi:uncharacterized protein (DUF302 family)